jgi:peptidoglycan hydrolase-like protein with peptidoglycan-binding domain/3D (Asp-Asp-Asp) domain-containing protein
MLRKTIPLFLAGILLSPPVEAALNTHALTPMEIPAGATAFEWEFLVSAYYSPVENQQRYLRGNLEAEKKLNGSGINGADGTPVFAGMIAAPGLLPFGTKIYIPGLGLGEVHDRGGAIQNSRLDVWLGSGDSGLNRALSWGKRSKHCTVFLPGTEVPSGLLAKTFASSGIFGAEKVPTVAISSGGSLKKGSRSETVRELQKQLQALGFLEEFEPTTYFGAQTEAALISFQLDAGVIDSKEAAGAGFFGPKTRAALALAQPTADGEQQTAGEEEEVLVASAGEPDAPAAEEVEKPLPSGEGQGEGPPSQEQEIAVDPKEELVLGETVVSLAQPETSQLPQANCQLPNGSLTLGSRGAEVSQLKEDLAAAGFETGSSGELFDLATADAVFSFQKAAGLLLARTGEGAGIFGPRTRERLKETLAGAGALEKEELVVLGEAAVFAGE